MKQRMLFFLSMAVTLSGVLQIAAHAADNMIVEQEILKTLRQRGDAQIQRVSAGVGQAGNDEIISLPQSSATDQAHDAGRLAVENALQTYYHDSGFGQPSVAIVGPTAGKQLQR